MGTVKWIRICPGVPDPSMFTITTSTPVQVGMREPRHPSRQTPAGPGDRTAGAGIHRAESFYLAFDPRPEQLIETFENVDG